MPLTQIRTSNLDTTNSLFFRNRIINGDMRIDQRNAGASVTITTANEYSVDRFFGYPSVSSKFTLQQNAGAVTPPAGFVNYLGAVSLAATSLAAGDFYTIVHRIEGYNIADLAWGTASAASVTLSFKVYSSLTGTFGGCLSNSGSARSYPFTYSIPAANTWTTISVTVAGDTSGTWLTTNGIGLQVFFGLGVGTTYSGTAGAWAGAGYFSATGATSVVGTNGATFYITGVQLENGTAATAFERRPYGTELALCQRYYSITTGTARAYCTGGSQYVESPLRWTVEMRTAPSTTITSPSTGNGGTPGVQGISKYGARHTLAAVGAGDTYDIAATIKASAEL